MSTPAHQSAIARHLGKTYSSKTARHHRVRRVVRAEVRHLQGMHTDGYCVGYTVPGKQEIHWTPAANFLRWLKNAKEAA